LAVAEVVVGQVREVVDEQHQTVVARVARQQRALMQQQTQAEAVVAVVVQRPALSAGLAVLAWLSFE
jgi:hypothetical protein